MTVKELIKELKRYDDNTNVAVVTDWENYDEDGNLPTEIITGVSEQVYVDVQFGYKEEREVIILL
jgi:hypothetical protein